MKTNTIRLSEEHVAIINAALAEAPFAVAAPVIAHINSEITRLYNEQYDKQREPKQEPLEHHSA